MKKTGLLLCLLSFIFSCNNNYNKNQNPYKYIPSNSSIVIEIKELNVFLNTIENHEILNSLYNKEINSASKVLNHLNPKLPTYLAFVTSNDKKTDYIVLTENDSALFQTDSIKNFISETLKSSNVNKIQIDSSTFYHKNLKNVFALSNSSGLLKNLSPSEEDNELINLIETTNRKSIASIILKSGTKAHSKLTFNYSNSENKTHLVLDLSHTGKNLTYNGIAVAVDSTSSIIDNFKNTIPQTVKTTEVTPRSAKSLMSITFNSYINFNEKDSVQTFLNFTNEIALFETYSQKAIITHSLDPNMVLESITNSGIEETFRDIEIYSFETTDFFKERLKPFFSLETVNYYSAYEEFIIFSDEIETLKSILADALNNNTLANSDAFLNIKDKLSDESSLFIYKNSDGISEIFEKDFSNYNANAVQFIYENDFAHVNGVIQEYKKRAATNSVSESFTTKLNSNLLAAPQAVKNHVSGAHDIVAQDINNTLYLISNSGSVLWKKQLQGRILGKVEQIDMYKNGRLQLAFATQNRVYVLDRNGNDVSPFPLKFNDDITHPLSVFDYDNNKNYRLLVTQGKALLMYDAKGKNVSGFDYDDNGLKVTSQPKHFRIGTKDYIAFETEDKLKILNRQGDTRIAVNETFNFSENELFLYQNNFTTTNTLGELIQINTSGKVNKKNLSLPDKHQLTTTSKTLVSLTENKLNIKSRTVNLDFGNYTEPRIFYLNDKIYVSVTDLQAKKVYLFDSQAKPIPNFPVFGTSAAELQKLDNESGLELITQSDNETILVYKLY